MKFVLKVLSSNWIAYLLTNMRGYENNVQFWTMYLLTSFAILILFGVFEEIK